MRDASPKGRAGAPCALPPSLSWPSCSSWMSFWDCPGPTHSRQSGPSTFWDHFHPTKGQPHLWTGSPRTQSSPNRTRGIRAAHAPPCGLWQGKAAVAAQLILPPCCFHFLQDKETQKPSTKLTQRGTFGDDPVRAAPTTHLSATH